MALNFSSGSPIMRRFLEDVCKDICNQYRQDANAIEGEFTVIETEDEIKTLEHKKDE